MSEIVTFEDVRVSLSREDIAAPGIGGLASIVAEPADRPARGTVLLPATYGKRQEAFCAMSISLVMNGWRVVRFDLRNNEGASAGAILDFCFLTMVEDIGAAARHVHARYGEYRLLATSLAARAAVRAFPGMPLPLRTVFVMPVVHAGATVDHASEARPYHKWISGTDRDLSTGDVVDGFLINRGFIARAIEADLLSPEGSARELGEIEPDVAAIFSLDDDWISAPEAEAVFGAGNDSRIARGLVPHRLNFVEGVSHELGKNPVLFRQVFDIVARELAPESGDAVRHAPFRLIASAVRVERELLKRPAAPEAPAPVPRELELHRAREYG